MEKEIFKQLEKHFDKEWSCSCGGAFDSDWAELISESESSVQVRYLCQICGRGQIFKLITQDTTEEAFFPVVFSEPVSSDDVLGIKEEIGSIGFTQIKALVKKRTAAKVNSAKPD